MVVVVGEAVVGEEEVEEGRLVLEVEVHSRSAQGCLSAAASWVSSCVWVQDGWRRVRQGRQRGRG